jgi:PadR family transcriptional regulator PadR
MFRGSGQIIWSLSFRRLKDEPAHSSNWSRTFDLADCPKSGRVSQREGADDFARLPLLICLVVQIRLLSLVNERFGVNSSFENPSSTASLDKRWSNVYYHIQFEGRMSSMAKEVQQRSALLQSTLDMLILRTLLYGPAHGHQIGKHIQRTTNEFLQMQHGSLYPALHRLEKRGWVVSKWETAPDRNREFKYYRLTERGRKQLVVEESQWKQMAEAVARVMWPATEES